MTRSTHRPLSDEQIDRLILKVAVSGRISHTDLESLATHIHTLRAQTYGPAIIPARTPGSASATYMPGKPHQP